MKFGVKGDPVKLGGTAQVKKNVRRTGRKGKDRYHFRGSSDRRSPSCVCDLKIAEMSVPAWLIQ